MGKRLHFNCEIVTKLVSLKKGAPPSHSLVEPKQMRITHATNDLFVGLDGIRLGFQQAMDGLELETECVFSMKLELCMTMRN